MDAENAPEPDSFSGKFYKVCWNIIEIDLTNAVLICHRRKSIPKGFNSSFLVLLLKPQGAQNIINSGPMD